MTEYLKFTTLDPIRPDAKTHRVAVSSRMGGNRLGTIGWYASWRQYCFYPRQSSIFNPECLDAISAKCREMTANHRALAAERRR